MALLVSESWNALSSWNFYNPSDWSEDVTAKRSLYSDFYVSPPACLAIGSPLYALLKGAVAQDLKTGTLISWVRSGAAGSRARWVIGVTGEGGGNLIWVNITAVPYEFKRRRLSWWQDGGNTKYRTDYWDGSAWVLGDELSTTGMTGDTNRCGLLSSTVSGARTNYFDNTEIYDTADEEGLGSGEGAGEGISYPADAITRVTGITHNYDRARSIYQEVLQLGGLPNLPSLEEAYQDIVSDPTEEPRKKKGPGVEKPPRPDVIPPVIRRISPKMTIKIPGGGIQRGRTTILGGPDVEAPPFVRKPSRKQGGFPPPP